MGIADEISGNLAFTHSHASRVDGVEWNDSLSE